MNKTNEALAATATGVAAVSWGWVDQANHVLQLLVTLAGFAWWVRLWIRKPELRPPGLPDDRQRCHPMVVLVAVLFVLATAGCAYRRPQMETEERGTNGTVRIVRTSSPTWALWPATQELNRERLSNGKTQSIGSEGVTQETGATNVAETFDAATRLIRAVRP